jgi:hypothetical protein
MGKFSTLSTLEDSPVLAYDSLKQADAVADTFRQALAVHNRLVESMLGDLVMYTDQAELPFPGTDRAIIQEVDEWGAADASKATSAGQVGFPLRRYSGVLQWTNMFLENARPSQLAMQIDAFAAEDLNQMRRSIAVALFNPVNVSAYIDRNQTKRTYPLKALLNGDGQAIPISPNGSSFDGATHTHFLGSATLTAGHLQALIDTVVEHGVDGKIVLYIARADEATVRGLSGFSAYLDSRITVVGAAQIGNQALDTTNPDNRAIGVFGGAEVWVKPWVPANYQVVLDIGGSIKPLGLRTRTGSLTGAGAFRWFAEHSHEPLHAEYAGREYGIAAYGRHKAAAGRSNNATYAAPTIV